MTDDPITQCAAKVLDAVHSIMRAVGTEMGRQDDAALSIRQIIALHVIRDEVGASLSFLSRHVGGSISGASKLVDGLVELGYVLRATADDDRRKLTLAISAAGERALAAVDRQEMRFLTEKLEALTPGECAMVNLVMDLLRETVAMPGRKAGTGSPRRSQ